MTARLKLAIKNALGPYFWSRTSFSQEGEDMILDRLMGGVKSGFYVEVGGHHPFRFSNTYLFYRRGWSGVCIDPLPGTKRLFNRWRRRDIAVEVGISNEPSKVTSYMFNEVALNTFDSKLAAQCQQLSGYWMTGTTEIPTDTLSNILSRYLPQNQSINFLSVDVEGWDLKVLQSNNWEKYRPEIVISECLNADIVHVKSDPVTTFLDEVGYVSYAKTGNSVEFTERSFATSK